MRRDMDGDDQVAIRAVVAAGIALAADADLGIVVHSGRDLDPQAGGFFHPAVAAAGAARDSGQNAAAAAIGADGSEFHEPGLLLDAALSPAGRADGLTRSGVDALALAGGAGLSMADLDRGLDAVGRVHEIQVHGVIEILAAFRFPALLPGLGARTTHVAEYGFEDVAEGAVAAGIEIKTFEIAAAAAAAPAIGPQRAVKVVLLPFFRILQRLVRFIDFLEFLLGRLVAWIQVGVVLAGQFAVGLFNVIDAGILAHAQDFIKIFHMKNITLGR